MLRVISVNVGLPNDVSWRGETVHTGIWKSRVQGRAVARRLKIDGDGQADRAGHGREQRAVRVYQLASAGAAPAWPGFRCLRVSRIDRKCDDVLPLSLQTPNRSALPAALPGQIKALKQPLDSGKPAVRLSYSLSSALVHCVIELAPAGFAVMDRRTST